LQASFLKQITRSPDVYQIQYCHKFYPDGKITVAFVKMDQKLAVHGNSIDTVVCNTEPNPNWLVIDITLYFVHF